MNDGSDDFDFVILDSDEASGFDRMTFRALDGKNWTDSWFTNRDELDYGTDPWDPDNDDDGLTDGWEINGAPDYDDPSPYTDQSLAETSATDPDTDGDGYWDGWIGVYGVSYTDNVILYRENLQSGDGIEGDEIVNQQVGYHDVSAVPSALGADIDDDDNDEHSNIHIGERQWGTAPDDNEETPSPSRALEVDYYENISSAFSSGQWGGTVEQNFAMYGIDIEMQDDETLDHGDLTSMYLGTYVRDNRPPLTGEELNSATNTQDIEDIHQDESVDTYVFVANRSADVSGSDVFFPGQGGAHLPAERPADEDVIAIFTEGQQSQTNRIPYQVEQNLSSDEELRSVATLTMVHEIGHAYHIGEVDDTEEETIIEIGPVDVWNASDEVYSGNGNDQTPERVDGRYSRTSRWSVMASGTTSESYSPPANGQYFAFSIEELLSVEE